MQQARLKGTSVDDSYVVAILLAKLMVGDKIEANTGTEAAWINSFLGSCLNKLTIRSGQCQKIDTSATRHRTNTGHLRINHIARLWSNINLYFSMEIHGIEPSELKNRTWGFRIRCSGLFPAKSKGCQTKLKQWFSGTSVHARS